MKRRYPMFLVVSMFASVVYSKDIHRLSLYFDHYGSENYNGEPAMAGSFGVTIHQEASAAVVAQSIFKNYLLRKFDYLLTRVGIAQEGLREEDNFFKALIFKLSNWDIYRIKKTSFFLFVPKNISYDVTIPISKAGSTSITFSLLKPRQTFPLQSGFSDWEKFVPIGADDVADIKALYDFCVREEKKKDLHPTIVADLKKIFLTDDDIKQYARSHGYNTGELKDVTNWLHAFANPWVFTCNGHGNVGQAIIGLLAADAPGLLEFFNSLNVFLMLFNSCSAGGENLDFYQFTSSKPKSFYQELRYYLIIAAITDAMTVRLFRYQTMGLRSTPIIDSSIDVSKFFQAVASSEVSKVRSNQQWLSRVLETLSLTDSWFYSRLGSNGIPQLLIPHLGWFETFDMNPYIFSLNRTILRKHELEKSPVEIKNKLAVIVHPSVVLPALSVRPKKLDKAPEWFSDWNVFPVISTHKGNPAELHLFPSFISKKQGSAIHVLHEVIVGQFKTSQGIDIGVLQFLRDSFFNLQQRTSKKSFLIKTVKGVNDFSLTLQWNLNQLKAAGLSKELPVGPQQIELHDVFIQAWTQDDRSITIPSSADKSKWHVNLAFEYQGKYWKYQYHDNVIKVQGTSLFPKDVNQVAWDFIELTKDEYDLFVTEKEPRLPEVLKEYEAALADYNQRTLTIKEPNGKFFIPQPPVLSKQPSSLAEKLSGLGDALKFLKNKLSRLSAKLGVLSLRLGGIGKPVHPIFSKEAIEYQMRNQKTALDNLPTFIKSLKGFEGIGFPTDREIVVYADNYYALNKPQLESLCKKINAEVPEQKIKTLIEAINRLTLAVPTLETENEKKRFGGLLNMGYGFYDGYKNKNELKDLECSALWSSMVEAYDFKAESIFLQTDQFYGIIKLIKLEKQLVTKVIKMQIDPLLDQMNAELSKLSLNYALIFNSFFASSVKDNEQSYKGIFIHILNYAAAEDNRTNMWALIFTILNKHYSVLSDQYGQTAQWNKLHEFGITKDLSESNRYTYLGYVCAQFFVKSIMPQKYQQRTLSHIALFLKYPVLSNYNKLILLSPLVADRSNRFSSIINDQDLLKKNYCGLEQWMITEFLKKSRDTQEKIRHLLFIMRSKTGADDAYNRMYQAIIKDVDIKRFVRSINLDQSYGADNLTAWAELRNTYV